MASKKLRCAVIGTGAIGLDHLQSLMVHPGADIVAIAESDPNRSREAEDRYKITRSYVDYRELLDQPDLDAVTIALPNHLHAQVAIEALKARKHVFLEKPMATHARDAKKIIEAARRYRRTCMVGMNFRFNRHTQAVHALITKGALGEVYHVRSFWVRRSGIPRIGSWFTQKQLAGGGCTYDIGVHLLDATLHLLNDFKVSSVTAQIHSKFGPRGVGETNWGKSEIHPKRPFDVEDYSVALLRLKNGHSIILESGWAAFLPPDRREFGIDLLGTEGGISLFPARLFRNGKDGYETVNVDTSHLALGEDRIHHFVTCVLEGKKPMVTLDQCLKVQEILDAIYTSAKTNREVALK